MPFKILRDSYKYCTENIWFFLFILIVLFGCQFVTNLFDSVIIGPIITSIVMVGYGLIVTEDIINGGTKLPKIIPKKVINFGVKGNVIFAFYFIIQAILLTLVSVNLNFPDFELEHLILHFSEVIQLFQEHDPVSFTIFFVSGFIIVYVTTFFMELSIARLADGGKLRKSFNFRRIKHAIDIIGWKNYSWDYTKIIISIIILTHLVDYKIPFVLVDSAVDGVLSFFIFIIEFIGIAGIYKVYVDNKPGRTQKIDIQ